MRWSSIFFFTCFCSTAGYGQLQPRTHRDRSLLQGKNVVLTDTFSGLIRVMNEDKAVQLLLLHEPFADMGTFLFNETAGSDARKWKGQWTVLKGSASDENATVVELDLPGRTEYFLRLKNGNLQQLDTSLKKIKPVQRYLLIKNGE